MDSKLERLAGLIIHTAKAHHQAFEDVNGEDPEWPQWYAASMHADFERLIGRSVGVDGLADLLERFDELHAEEAPDEKWPHFYARKLVDFYSD